MPNLINKIFFGAKVLSDQEISKINPHYKTFKELQQHNKSIEDSNSVLQNTNLGAGLGNIDLNTFMSQNFEFTDTTNTEKINKLLKYRRIAAFPEISDIIDEYVTSMIIYDDQNNFSTLKFKKNLLNDKHGAKINKLKEEYNNFISLFDLNNSGEEYLREFLVDGELSFEIITDEKKTDSGILAVKKIPTETYDYILDINNNPVGILLNAERIATTAAADITADVIKRSKEKSSNQSTSADNGWINVINKNVSYRYCNKKEQVIPLPLSQIVHFTSGITACAGTVNLSILERAKRPFNQLRLTEDAITIYRIVRAPMRYLFKVYTGNMPWHKARRVIERLKETYGSKKFYDPVTGTISSDFDVHSITESFWFAKGAGGEGSEVETIGEGESMWSSLPDLIYYLRKLYRVMKVPFSNMIDGESKDHIRSKESDITYEDYRFAKMIMSLQRRLAKGLYYGFKTHLELKGLWDNYNLDDSYFNIVFTPPALFDLYYKQKIMNIKYDNYQLMADRDDISVELAQREILGWDETQINKNNELIRKEKLWQAQLEKQIATVDDIGITVQQNPPSDDSSVGSKW